MACPSCPARHCHSLDQNLGIEVTSLMIQHGEGPGGGNWHWEHQEWEFAENKRFSLQGTCSESRLWLLAKTCDLQATVSISKMGGGGL